MPFTLVKIVFSVIKSLF